MRLSVFCLVAAWLIALPSFAQDVVGRTVIDGRAVTLFDNKSWKFDAAAAVGCRPVTTNFSFCGSPDVWTSLSAIDPGLTAQFQYDDRNYALFVHEKLGRADGMSEELLRKAIIGNAANGSGARVEDIVVLGTGTSLIDGHEASQITYLVNFNGLDLVFRNSFIIADDFSLQAATYSFGKSSDAAFQSLHETYLGLIKLDGLE